jgi:type IV secretory pathway VirJ component
MRRLIHLLAAAAFAVMPPALARTFDDGTFGEVRVEQPRGAMRGYVMLFSDTDGWNDADQRTLEAIARQGGLAVGIDTKVYLARLASGERVCDYLVAAIEGLSRGLQREYGGSDYRYPILAGTGEGGALAAAILMGAPANTLSGAASLDPTAGVHGPRPLCTNAPWRADTAAGYVYGPPASLQGFWSVGLTTSAPARARQRIDTLRGAGTPLTIQSFGSGTRSELLAGLIVPHFARKPAAALPLVELPAPNPSPLMAIVLSGDGGWRDLDKTIAEDLRSSGVSVVGLDSLRYFWEKKSPEQTTADVATVIDDFTAKWGATKVALIGYSFGADVLPFVYDRLPAGVKGRVVLVSLLGCASAADWEIHVTGWLGAPPSTAATPIVPAILSVPGALIQCFYGEDERDTVCPSLEARGAEIIRTKGSHHFGGDYSELAQKILAGFKRRSRGGT